jgi:hypothetical protein
MSNPIHIVGAGMAGLVAAHAFRRNFAPVVLEAQDALPNNHEALLRFRSEAVSRTCGISFRSCKVRKTIYYRDNFYQQANVLLANMYSEKVIGRIQDRSIWDLEDCTRYIAPSDFLGRLSEPLKVAYDRKLTEIDQFQRLAVDGPVVSTVPMPIMMKMVGWSDMPKFDALPIWSIQLSIEAPVVDVHQTAYFPDPTLGYYRASLVGSRLIIEFVEEPLPECLEKVIFKILQLFGIERARFTVGDLKLHRFGKIAPIDDDLRREFIYTLTRQFGVYSLGRFATWKPLLLDDVVGDCAIIERLIDGEARRSRYNQSLASVRSL